MADHDLEQTRKLLSTLYSRGIQPVGRIRLESVCELEATFRTAYYDGFFVNDSTPLQKAIANVSPFCASRMERQLHMTVRYPGRGKIPSMSDEDAEAFGQGSNFPAIRIFVRDIYVSKGRNLAAAVVFGVDTAVAAMINVGDINGSTPPHLTLWASGGYRPVSAGLQLVRLQLETRTPFVQATADCMRSFVKKQRDTIAKLNKIIAEKSSLVYQVTRERDMLKSHATVVDGLIVRRALLLQATVRKWLKRIRTDRWLRMQKWSAKQHSLLRQMLQQWLRRRWPWRRCYNSYGYGYLYDDYDYYSDDGFYY